MKILRFILALVVVAMLASCGSSRPSSYSPTTKKKPTTTTKPSSGGSQVGKVLTGKASYYADKFHGRPTASGEKYDKRALTAAHRTLDFGTKVKVTNLSNGKSVTVRINDRGPFVEGRIIDLSSAAADKIDMKTAGVVNVKVEILSVP